MQRYNQLFELADVWKINPETKKGNKLDKTKEYLSILEKLKKDWNKIGLEDTLIDPIIEAVEKDIKEMGDK